MVQKQAMPNEVKTTKPKNRTMPVKTQPPVTSVKKPLKKTIIKKSVVQTKPLIKTQAQPILTKKITPNMFEGERKQTPILVKIAGILYYIFAGIFILGGILLFFVSTALADFMSLSFLTGIWFYILPLVGILIAALFFFIGNGLFKLKKWAKILAIIFAGLGFISSIYALIRVETLALNIIILIIEGYILYVLLIDKLSRQAFN